MFPLRVHRLLLFLLLAPVVVFDAVCGVRLRELARRRTDIKVEYSQINSFYSGILSVDNWKQILQKIVNRRITDFTFSKEQEEVLKFETTIVLNVLLTEAEDKFAQDSKKRAFGGIRSRFEKSFVEKTRKDLPEFARSIDDEIAKPSNMNKLKALARKQFNVYAALTHDDGDGAERLKALLAKYHAASIDEFNATVDKAIAALDEESGRYTLVLLGSALVFLFAWWAVRKSIDLHHPLFMLSVAFAFVLLLTSLAIPMMEVDARIKSLDFTLMGEKMHFNDQVLYYRSKSLLEMVRILMASGEADSMAVGVLILLFSILFPVTKLVATELYLLGGEKIRKSALVDFFAFKSGKWHMADVTVVAIFMAYVGFRGIVNNQLQNLNVTSGSLESIATNASSLQPGFVVFTTFVLYGLILSEILKRIMEEENIAESA